MPQENKICQIKATLLGVEPPVWRRILVPDNYSLKDLHDVLQEAFGWGNSHLHQFVAKKVCYGTRDAYSDMDIVNEKRVRIDDVLPTPRSAIIYEYDFGDGWEHKIVLEKLHNNPANHRIPVCVDGARACPPEDCGGPWGYETLLQALVDPTHPEHEMYSEWIGGPIDPEFFDIGEVNQYLSKIRRKGLVKAGGE